MTFGWWANPIFHRSGDYPYLMKSRVKFSSHLQNFSATRLPPLSSDEIKQIKGSADFLGINYYTGYIVSNDTNSTNLTPSFENDLNVKREYNPEWRSSSLPDLKDYPDGLRDILKWTKEKYKNPLVYITENGFADNGEVNDTNRINYLRGHLSELQKAIVLDHCKVKAYSVWSLMDNFAGREGYATKFGLYSVNFKDPFKTRSPKASAAFYKNVIDAKSVTINVDVQLVSTE
ncbi:hypothetical protein PPYR_04335 [Photinus pyralis]|nr:hypothetical protein PPYR_04335 [Photinus pyralis]